jgi:hypothetical protein
MTVTICGSRDYRLMDYRGALPEFWRHAGQKRQARGGLGTGMYDVFMYRSLETLLSRPPLDLCWGFASALEIVWSGLVCPSQKPRVNG